MDKEISCRVEIKTDKANIDLVPLAGLWQAKIDVRVSNPAQFTRGPINIISRGQNIIALPSKFIQPVIKPYQN
jgi:hypothetical protein